MSSVTRALKEQINNLEYCKKHSNRRLEFKRNSCIWSKISNSSHNDSTQIDFLNLRFDIGKSDRTPDLTSLSFHTSHYVHKSKGRTQFNVDIEPFINKLDHLRNKIYLFKFTYSFLSNPALQ